MHRDTNVWVGEGFMISDPKEHRNTGGDLVRVEICIALGSTAINTDSDASFLCVQCYKHNAEFVIRHAHKGSRVRVTGSLGTVGYERDGVKAIKWEVRASDVGFSSSRSIFPEEYDTLIDDRGTIKPARAAPERPSRVAERERRPVEAPPEEPPF